MVSWPACSSTMQLATSSVCVSRSPSASASSERRHQVVLGHAAALLGELAEVVLERAGGDVAARARRRVRPSSRPPGEVPRELLDAGEVALGDAEDVRDHVEGELVVVVLDELGVALRFDAVAQLVGDALGDRAPLGDGLLA